MKTMNKYYYLLLSYFLWTNWNLSFGKINGVVRVKLLLILLVVLQLYWFKPSLVFHFEDG